MSLAKQVRKLNLESENQSFIDEEVVVPSIEEQLEAEEAEAELVEVLDEVEENQDALEESEEVEAEIDDHIAEAEATVAEAEGAVGDASAEAEGPAAEEGETPAEASEETDAGEVAPEEVADAPESVLDENGELPVEEVVAAQEALQNLLKRTGYTLPNRITVSREDVRSNPLEAYKMNLEDWKELKEKVQAGAKKIWEAILKAYAWIKEQILKVIPTKAKKVQALLAAVKNANIDDAKLAEVAKMFNEKYNVKYAAAAQVAGSAKGITTVADEFKRVAATIKQDAKALATLNAKEFATVIDGNVSAVYSVANGEVSVVETEVKDVKAAELGKENALKLLQQYNGLLAQIAPSVATVTEATQKLSKEADVDPKVVKLAQKVSKIVIKSFKAANSEIYTYVIAFAQAVLKASVKA
jgi:immediate-early protein